MHRIRRNARMTAGLVLGMFVLCAAPCPAMADVEPEVYVGLESFVWTEYGQLGERLLEESGPRVMVGFAMARVFESGFTFKPRVEILGGSVDYDGATQAGIPVQSTTNYFGLKLEADMGFRSGEGLVSEPFFGIGMRVWDRMLKDGTTILGTPAYGYTEEWTVAYGRVGFRILSRSSEDGGGHFEIGMKLPLASENTALLSEKFVGAVDLTFEPKQKSSLFAEAGYRSGRFKMALYYDTMRFDASDPVYDPATMGYYYQPESRSDMYGVRIGAEF